ncbi:TetR/AcrR family transcriptional regulator [Sporomusa sp.]|uniref:TetR/AcrR family transcriptional regulator n=1 Tax=Sporomusa sp. TaxID=2078658 RepID=UPI002D00C64A|nr:TetR/AcrR family transcriptional regulator [Sporomusa sp.]HWR43602.1 TetR/AcrR family transcriptional regulator [Sporomusa sp.]
MTRKIDKKQRVEEIINAAVDEFVEKGYENASMESIAVRAGISKGGVYHHFKSKREVLFAANQRLSEPIYEFITEAQKSHSPAAALREYVEKYIFYWNSHRRELTFFLLSMTTALSSPEVWPMYAEYTVDMIDFLEGLYKRAISLGEMLPHDTRSSAVTLMAALDGIISYSIMIPAWEPQEITALFNERFIKCVSKT